MKQGWEIKKLGEVCKFQRGLTYSKEDEVELSNNCVLRSNNISLETMSIILDELKYVREDLVVSEEKKVKPHTILVCMSNGSKQHIGKVAFIDKAYDYAFGGFMGLITPIESVCPKYVYYACVSQPYKHFLSGIGNGANITNLKFSDLSQFVFPIPPREEQERIVEELDCLSGVIEKKREQLRELDALAQSIFYQMFGDPITNEKGWEVKKLGEVGKVITGNTPSTKDEENYSSNDYCFVKPSDIGKDYVTKIENTEFYISEKAFSQSRRLSKGSVLTTCIGIIGKVGILKVDATCNQQINAILPDANSVSEYVAWAIYQTRSVLENIANAPVVPIINKGEFSNILIPLPPKALQQEFADKIEAIEKQKELIKQSITQTEELFNSRMDYYFN